ncbi:hypothetical protein CHS0354_029809, partial [Potamilus streckersoni]
MGIGQPISRTGHNFPFMRPCHLGAVRCCCRPHLSNVSFFAACYRVPFPPSLSRRVSCHCDHCAEKNMVKGLQNLSPARPWIQLGTLTSGEAH